MLLYRSVRLYKCSVACQEGVFDMNGCQENICKNVKASEVCKHSCLYLREIYRNKPGTCTNGSYSTLSDECTALCHMDGDCPEIKKCCVVGCGRQCMKPREKDRHLLPIPTGVSVQERKRKRSVIVRWVMQQMGRAQLNTNSNLYVVQWCWSLQKDGTPMSDWQTIVTRNKMYAILKHLLAPGRYYMFRVAAVNTYGSLGFSKSSQPFKLSKEPRAPGQPRDLSLVNSRVVEQNYWKQRIVWTPPLSELPIKNYILSWQKSTVQHAAAYEELLERRSNTEKQEKRSTLNEEDEENENEDSFIERERMSVVIPAYHSHADIDHLQPASVYLVEIHATVDSTDGELHGEKAVVYVRTGCINDSETMGTNDSTSIGTAAPMTTTKYRNWEQISFHNELWDKTNIRTDLGMVILDIKTPYFDDDNLKTVVSWFDGGICTGMKADYTIRWRLLMCRTKDGQRLTYYDLDTSGEDWSQMLVHECVAILEDLVFACSYNVELIATSNLQVLATGHFETQNCQETPSTLVLTCDDQMLFCTVNSKNNSARCSWKEANTTTENEPPAGYRIVLSASSTKENNQIIIKPPRSTTVQFDELEPNCDYLVHVQTITSNGLGNTLTTSFRINLDESQKLSSSSPDSRWNHSLSYLSDVNTKDEGDQLLRNIDLEPIPEKDDGFPYNNKRFPSATVLELPLENGASNAVRLLIVLFSICTDVLFRYPLMFNSL